MKWKKFKDKDSLEAGDIIFVKHKMPLSKMAFVDHNGVSSIPKQWSAATDSIDPEGNLVDATGRKWGQIKKVLKVKKPI